MLASMKRARKLAGIALRIILVFYTIAGLGLYFFQERLIFHPEPLSAGFRFEVKAPYEERSFEAGGERISALLVHAPASRGVLLHFHGNAGNLDGWSEIAGTLATRLRRDVLMIDYPGFGKSTGAIRSEAQLHEIADAALALAKREAKGKPVAVIGRSIGTGFAVRLAALNSVDSLVLETPYYSLSRLARGQYPWAPLFLLRYPLSSFEWMPQVKAPVLVLHGDADELIPYADGKELASLNPAARFVTIPGGHHNDLRRYDLYWAELTRFFQASTH